MATVIQIHDAVRAAGFTTVALTPDPAAEPVATIADLGRVALLLGARAQA